MGHFEVSAKTADNVQVAIDHVIQKALLKTKGRNKGKSLSESRKKKSKCC